MYYKDYSEWFETRTECQVSLHFHAVRPDRIQRNQLLYYDERAEREIREAKRYIEGLKEYRLALAKRMQELETMTYHMELSLVRHRGWSGRVTYRLTLSKVYEDGTNEELSSTDYEGKERHKAIAEYRHQLQLHPGINAKMDIAKSPFER